MINNNEVSGDREWQELVFKFESRSISSIEFCKLHNISKASIYKWRKIFMEERAYSAESNNFISLAISQDSGSTSNHMGKKISVSSPLKISNSLGLTIEFSSGCKLFELAAIIEVLNATK
jgi:hypothetical protein